MYEIYTLRSVVDTPKALSLVVVVKGSSEALTEKEDAQNPLGRKSYLWYIIFWESSLVQEDSLMYGGIFDTVGHFHLYGKSSTSEEYVRRKKSKLQQLR